MFLKYDFFFDDGKKSSFEFVQKLYEHGLSSNVRLAPKLTPANISPNNFQKMKVKLATQVLSSTVAAGIDTLTKGYVLPPVATETAEFIKLWDTAFDLFNSSKYYNAKKNKEPFSATEQQLETLEQLRSFIQSILVIDRSGKDHTSNIKCLNGWLLAISALLKLWGILKEEKFDFIFTRRLNQDSLEHHFGTLRSQGGNSHNPTPFQFCHVFKKSYSIELMELIKTGNCESGEDISVEFLIDPKEVFIPQASESNEDAVLANSVDYRYLDFGQENAIYYFAGYLLKKCRERHSCNICDISEEPNEFGQFIVSKQYEGCQLKVPKPEFVEYIKQLEKLFMDNFNRFITREGIEGELYSILQEVECNQFCENFPIVFLIKFFIRVRIYFVLKFYNNSLKQHGGKINFCLYKTCNTIIIG